MPERAYRIENFVLMKCTYMNDNISLKPTDFVKHAGLYIWENIFKNLQLSYNYPINV